MTIQDKIDELYRQMENTKSFRRKKELKKAVFRLEKERRRLKRGDDVIE